MIRIAIDAMGGDKAPDVTVKGAVLAARELDAKLFLVGREPEIRGILDKLDYPAQRIGIVNSSEEIRMDEPAAISVRRKRDSSIVKAVDLLKNGEADALISAGHTGAVVCASTLGLRLLPGIDRPGIAVVIPTVSGRSCFVIDVGANIDPKPEHLLQYGIMGDAYSKHILGKKEPSVALLNIGEESTKGTDFVKVAHGLLSQSGLNFVGNMEPKEVYKGKADIVVCDGFIGNVFLKVTESFAFAATEFLKRELEASGLLTKLGAFLMLPAFKALRKKVDAAEYGGAPLMGVDGRVIICHGSSDDISIKNAVKAAFVFISHDVNAHILEELNSFWKK